MKKVITSKCCCIPQTLQRILIKQGSCSYTRHIYIMVLAAFVSTAHMAKVSAESVSQKQFAGTSKPVMHIVIGQRAQNSSKGAGNVLDKHGKWAVSFQKRWVAPIDKEWLTRHKLTLNQFLTQSSHQLIW